MATRAANNLIAGQIQNYGAPVSHLAIDGGAALAGETNPGEAMEAIVETIQTFGTIVEIGTLDNGAAGAFKVAVENLSTDAATLQAAIRALGATVGSGNYDASAATVADHTY